MSRGTIWLMASLLVVTATAVRSAETPQTPQALSQQPTNFDGPRRFSHLYSATWEEIPIPQEALQNFIWATSITDDGTIAGKQGDALVLWHPDAQVWERVPRVLAPAAVFISPDGSSIIATDDTQSILSWNRTDGWQTLAGSTVALSGAYNVSRNFQFAVGNGANQGEASQGWVWAIDGGVQQMLPNPEWSTSVVATAVSDDGNVVVGAAVRAPPPGESYPEYLAVRWVSGGLPTQLRAPDGSEIPAAVACNADCSMVFGSNGWFLKNNGDFGFLFWSLGGIPDAYPDPYGPYATYSIYDVSSDGSMVAGLYAQNMYPQNPNSESSVQRPFLWTQATGVVSLRSLGIDDRDWQFIDAMRLSPDGRRLLIAGVNQSNNPRAAVVHLTPNPVRLTGGHSRHAMPSPPRANHNGSLRVGPIPMDQ